MLVKRRHRLDVHPEDMFLDVVWQSLELISGVYVCGNGKDYKGKKR